MQGVVPTDSDVQYASMLYLKGLHNSQVGDVHEATRYMRAMINKLAGKKLTENRSLHYLFANAHSVLGHIYRVQGDLITARQMHQRDYEIMQEMEEPAQHAAVRGVCNLGELSIVEDNWAAAIAFYNLIQERDIFEQDANSHFSFRYLHSNNPCLKMAVGCTDRKCYTVRNYLARVMYPEEFLTIDYRSYDVHGFLVREDGGNRDGNAIRRQFQEWVRTHPPGADAH
jgi:hypothetical protein